MIDAERHAALAASSALGGAPVVAVVGRLVPQKNHARFSRRCAARAGRPDVRFLVVGDGALRAGWSAQRARSASTTASASPALRRDAGEIIAYADVLVSLLRLGGPAASPPRRRSPRARRSLSTPVQGMARAARGPGGGIVAREAERGGAGRGARAAAIGDPARLEAMGAAAREIAAPATRGDG